MTAKRITYLLLICGFLALVELGCRTNQPVTNCNNAETAVTDPAHWSQHTRIAGHGLSMSAIPSIIKKVQETHVFGIETDNDIPGRYESWLDPGEKLAAITEMANQAHANGNRAFVYMAGMECITKAADSARHSFFRDHPDWVQRDREGNLAIFSDQDAFWIVPGDEDVWISPFAPDWRQRWMQHIRAVAGTGIDGVWLDIPYWMTHFDGWTTTWASFDKYTVAEFKRRKGLNALTDLDLGNYEDPNFIQWLDFRVTAITEFVAEARENMHAVNPNCLLIPEIYPGIGKDAVVVGADVYQLYQVSDAVAHEYSAGAYTAAAREPIDWFTYMTGMLSFRAFAEGKATWMLSYSWDEELGIAPADAMENLFMSQIMSGTHPYDARGHVMSGSNDYATRTRVYDWLAAHDPTFFQPRQPINPIGVYFSPKSRDYFTAEFIPAFKGILYLLMQQHLEFEIVTPRTLAAFSGKVLILPEARIISPEEVAYLDSLGRRGCSILTTGATGTYSEQRQQLDHNLLAALTHRIQLQDSPGTNYYHLAHSQFNAAAYQGEWQDNDCVQALSVFEKTLLAVADYQSGIQITAEPGLATQIAKVAGKPHIFFANYTGLIPEQQANQLPQQGVEVLFRNATAHDIIKFLPYLGAELTLESTSDAAGVHTTLPAIKRGAVVWLEQKPL